MCITSRRLQLTYKSTHANGRMRYKSAVTYIQKRTLRNFLNPRSKRPRRVFDHCTPTARLVNLWWGRKAHVGKFSLRLFHKTWTLIICKSSLKSQSIHFWFTEICLLFSWRYNVRNNQKTTRRYEVLRYFRDAYNLHRAKVSSYDASYAKCT